MWDVANGVELLVKDACLLIDDYIPPHGSSQTKGKNVVPIKKISY